MSGKFINLLYHYVNDDCIVYWSFKNSHISLQVPCGVQTYLQWDVLHDITLRRRTYRLYRAYCTESGLALCPYLRNFSSKLFIKRMARGSSLTESLISIHSHLPIAIKRNLSVRSAVPIFWKYATCSQSCMIGLTMLYTHGRTMQAQNWLQEWVISAKLSLLINCLFPLFGEVKWSRLLWWNQSQTNALINVSSDARGPRARKTKQYKCCWCA